MSEKPAKKAKETKNEEQSVAVVEPKTTALAAKPQVSEGLEERFLEVQENFASLDSVKIPKIKMTSDGMIMAEGEDPVKEIVATMIVARATNVYYEKSYDKTNLTPPDCVSSDGKKPDSWITNPVAKTCKECPKAKFETAATGKGKACRNIKPIFLLIGDNSVMPRQLNVTPTSIKAFSDFLIHSFDAYGAYRHIKIQITAKKKDVDDKYCVLSFKFLEKLSDQRKVDVDYLRDKWMPYINRIEVTGADDEEGAVRGETVEAPTGEARF